MPSNTARRPLTVGDVALFVAIYLLLAMLITWPLVANLSTHLLDRSDDTPLHYWNSWWVQRALREGLPVYHTPYLFYPKGVSLVTHNIAWLNALIWATCEPFVGGIAAYNLGLLVNLALCGCGAYLLCHWLTGRHAAALVAGVIFQAWPYRMAELGHPNLLATQFLPLFVLFLLKTLQRGRWRDGIWTGVMFALVGYTRWQQMIAGALIALVCCGSLTAWWLPRSRRPVIWRLLLAVVVAALLLTPPLVLLIGQQSGERAADLVRQGEEELFQTDLLAYVTPSERHFLLGKLTAPAYARYYADSNALVPGIPAYIGLVPAILAFLGLRLRWREARLWLFCAVLFVALALGPVLRLNGRLYPQVPMPYRLMQPTLIIPLMRAPARFNMFLALPLAVLSGYGIDALLQRMARKPPRAALVTLCLGALALGEYLAVPIPLRPIPAPSSLYLEMAQVPDAYAVLNLPIDPLRAKSYMWDQTTHQHPIVQGNVSRMPRDAYAYIDSQPWLRGLREKGEMLPQLTNVTQQLEPLARDGIRYIILHKNLVGADRIAHWRRYLAMAPIFEDSEIVVYPTAPTAGRDIPLAAELAPGLGPVAVWPPSISARVGDTVELDVAWGSAQRLVGDYDVILRLLDGEERIAATGKYPLETAAEGDALPANSLVWGYYPVSLETLVPGEYTVAAQLIERATGQALGEPSRLKATVAVGPKLDAAMPGSSSTTHHARFGAILNLVDYRVVQEGDQLHCRLVWRADRRMGADYKVFVHVFDPASGVPVAQDDAMPHRWAYPTTLWWPGETVDDGFAIPLAQAPPGRYGIAIGVYDPQTGTRLSAIDANGRPLADDRLVLPQSVVIVR